MPASILLVQPDPAQAQRLQHLIHDLGRDSRTVRDGEAAMALLRKDQHIELVVLELELPGMDGLELLQNLRRQHPPEQIAAVVITAFPNLRTAATRQQRNLGIAALESSKATALALNTLFKEILRALPKRTLTLKPPPKPLAPASLNAPTELFKQLARQKEVKRLARITALHLTQELPQDEALQKLVRETAQAFDFPVALISLAMQDRQVFKVHVGLSDLQAARSSTPRDWASCAPTLEPDEPAALIVPDTRKHPAFRDNPLVESGQVGSYAGVPILTDANALLGTLCLVDHKPRHLSGADVDLLCTLGRRVAGEIEVNQRLNHLQADRRQQRDLVKDREAQLDVLRGVLESLHLGVLLHDSRRKVVLANDRLCELTGMQRARIEGGDAERFLLDLLDLFDDPDGEAHRMRVLEEGPYVANEVFELVRPLRRILRWSARPVHVGDAWYQLATWEDITAEVDLEAQRERLATVDPLTELMNRHGGEEEGKRECERARRKKGSFSILRLKLEGLRELNRKLGRAKGDEALQTVGACLRQSLRLVDRPARWSGRQFMVILPETDDNGARLVAKRIRDTVAKLEMGLPLNLLVGVGSSGKEPDFKVCLELAEKRLHEALEKSAARP